MTAPPKTHHGDGVEPHGVSGAHGVSFELTDARAGFVLGALSIIAGTLIASLIITIFIDKFLHATTPLGQRANERAPERVIPPEPRLEVHPWEVLPKLREHEDQMLTTFGKDAQGHQRIPIDDAMRLVLGRLPVRPDSPTGLRIPGGNQYGFTDSVNSLPPTYQAPKAEEQPQLKGKVEKSAQQQ